jgi:hypothetical protein
METLKHIGLSVGAFFITALIFNNIEDLLAKRNGIPPTQKHAFIDPWLTWWVSLAVAVGVFFLARRGFDSPAEVLRRALLPAALGLLLLAAGIGGFWLWGRTDHRKAHRKANQEKAQPDYDERCATARRLIVRACGAKDHFSDEAVSRKARLHGQTYLAREKEIEATHEDPKDPLFSAGRCLEMAGFARRHLQDMKEVKPLDDDAADELAAVLEQLHEYEFRVLCLARSERDSKLEAEARDKEEKQRQQAEAERREADLRARELERVKPKSPIAETAERRLALAKDLQEAINKVNASPEMSKEEKEELVEMLRAVSAEHAFRARRESGLA